MKRILFFILITLLVCITFIAVKETISNDPASVLKRISFARDANPDKLTYAVKFLNIFSTGIAQIDFEGEETLGGRTVYHISAKAQTLEAIKPFFEASARIDSFIDKRKMHSLRFVENTKIKGREDKIKSIIYNQEKHTMIYKGEERVIEPDTQDPLSAIFYIRNQDLSVGKKFDIYFNTNQKIYIMSSEVLNKRTYHIKGKDLSVWEINAKICRADGNPYHQTSLRFYLLDNQTKTLLLIKVFSGVGIISAPLIEVN